MGDSWGWRELGLELVSGRVKVGLGFGRVEVGLGIRVGVRVELGLGRVGVVVGDGINVVKSWA